MFTALSLIGLPGKPHSFTAKSLETAVAEVQEHEIFVGGGTFIPYSRDKQFKKLKLSQDDQDILEFIAAFVLSR